MSYLFAIWYNDKYIIAKQYPRIFSNSEDTIYDYILPLKRGMDWKNKNGLIGPFTLEQFNEKRSESKIYNDLSFTNVGSKLLKQSSKFVK